MVNTKRDLIQALEADSSTFRDLGIIRLGVFGSFLKDTAGPTSDVDLFVEFAPDFRTLKNLLGLVRHLEEYLGRKVEVVTPGSLNNLTGKYILQEVEYVALAA